MNLDNPLAYTMAAIKHCRHRFFPFLWLYMDRYELMCHVRSLAWLILCVERPESKRDLYNAVQRALYKEAKNDGWHREKRSNRYEQRIASLEEIVGDS